MERNNLTIKEVSEKLKSGEITSEKLTKQYLDKIKTENPKLNAYITVMDEVAIKMAKESDGRRKSGKTLSEIDGIPIAVKDVIATEGILTTGGSKILNNFIPPYDATVISKLKDAGAVIIGKTNCDEFAMGGSTENSAYGVTKNPHDETRVAGGSSGGSAAAVAADLCVAALGSDTGGSIREPSSFCGIVGFKPTYGNVSRYGLFAMASSLDQIGPMTKTVEDAKILFDIIKGHDEKDSTSVQNPKSETQMTNIKIGVPKEYFAEGLDPKVKKVIEDGIDQYKKAGAEVKEISLPNQRFALATYYILMPVEVSSNLARYDGIKYGLRAEADTLIDTYFNTRAKGFGDEAKRRIILGTYASSAGYVDQYYNKAQKVRALIKQDFDKAFEEVDFIMGPVSPTVAFKIGEKASDPLSMYLADIFTVSVNLSGLPAISVPVGEADGLPVGLHIIGPQFADDKILQIAKEFKND